MSRWLKARRSAGRPGHDGFSRSTPAAPAAARFFPGGGRVAEVFIGTGRGYFNPALTPEDVHAHVAALDHQDFQLPADAMAEVAITASLVLPREA